MIYLKLLTLNKLSFNSQNRTEQNYVFLEKKRRSFLRLDSLCVQGRERRT